MNSAWLLKILPSVNVIWEGEWPAGFREPPRYLFDHELVFVRKGRCRVFIEKALHELGEGDFIIIPPDTFHTSEAGPEGVHRFCLHFDWIRTTLQCPARALYTYAPQKPAKKYINPTPAFISQDCFTGKFRRHGPVDTLLTKLAAHWKNGDAFAETLCRGILLEIFAYLFSGENPTRAAVRSYELAYAAKTLLEKESTTSIQSLLASLGYSYPHICRQFHASFGLTPSQYRNILRLQKAAKLLTQRTYTIAEVAHASGFNSAGYFTRKFRKYYGVPPHLWGSRMH